MGSWTTVAAAKPRRHAKYFVRRWQPGLGFASLHTMTPCYGMHEPWWVELLADGSEAPPVDMHAGDEWSPIASENTEPQPVQG